MLQSQIVYDVASCETFCEAARNYMQEALQYFPQDQDLDVRNLKFFNFLK